MSKWRTFEKCEKCHGAGWVWWDELDQYEGPALFGGSDDTRYICDHPSHTTRPSQEKRT